MAQVVNLDALVPREDFLATAGLDAGSAGKSEARRTDLMKSEAFCLTLRKPDFSGKQPHGAHRPCAILSRPLSRAT